MRNHSPRYPAKTPAQGAFRGADQNRTGVSVVTPDPYFRFRAAAVALTVAALFLLGLSLAVNVPTAGSALSEGEPMAERRAGFSVTSAGQSEPTSPSLSAHLRAVAAIRQVFGVRAPAAIAVARCETGGTFNVRAVGRAGERGIFQLHPVHRGWIDRLYGWHRMFEAFPNARAAYRLSRGGTNWRPWTCRWAA